MSTPLDDIAAVSRNGLPLLLEKRATTQRRLRRRAELLEGVPLSVDLSVVFAGSWGRFEVTSSSDNDFYVLTVDTGVGSDEDAMSLIYSALEQEEYEETKARKDTEPGREGTFRKPVVLPHLLGRIGREEDSNRNLTQRILMVLESTSIYNTSLHERARQAIIDGYLEPPVKPNQPPRLFLNDVVRYWRTMCVDFAGKMRDRKGQGWGLRNAKLRTSRKILFASGLLPLLRCGDLDAERIQPFLLEQFAMPPNDRVADAFIDIGRATTGAELFEDLERFLTMLDDDSTRDALDAISGRQEAMESALFEDVVTVGDGIERRLLELLLDSELKDVTRSYAIF